MNKAMGTSKVLVPYSSVQSYSLIRVLNVDYALIGESEIHKSAFIEVLSYYAFSRNKSVTCPATSSSSCF